MRMAKGNLAGEMIEVEGGDADRKRSARLLAKPTGALPISTMVLRRWAAEGKQPQPPPPPPRRKQ